MGLMSICSRVPSVAWQEKPRVTSGILGSSMPRTPLPPPPTPWQKMTKACYTESVKFQNHLTGPGGLRAVIVNRQPCEERASGRKSSLTGHHQPGTSTELSKRRATAFYGLRRHHLSFFLYWKWSICSRQHYWNITFCTLNYPNCRHDNDLAFLSKQSLGWVRHTEFWSQLC